MKAWEEYALCDSTGEIKNIAVYQINGGGYTLANMAAHESYGSDGFAFEVTQYMAQIGDVVRNGKVYRGETEITALPTDEEEIETLNASVESLDETVDDILIEILGG